MNRIKINEIVSAYSKALSLSDYLKTVLIELMINIIEKYEKVVPNISIQNDKSKVYFLKPVNGVYSVEDFFLNRLMRNIWHVEELEYNFNDNVGVDNYTKAYYDPSMQQISLNKNKIKTQLEKYKLLFGNNYNKARSASIKKIIMHEFEHGLQTRFDDSLDMRYKSSYSKIFEELNKLNKYNINSFNDMNKGNFYSNYINTGVHYSHNKMNDEIKTYRDVVGFDNLNEILNESESLEMSKQDVYLAGIVKDSVYSNYMFTLYNPESSNYSITNYGNIFKKLLGDYKSFEMMYLNPSEGFKRFNFLYNDVFKSMYNTDKDAIELFILAITKIKKTNAMEDHELLCLTLSKCLNKKLNYFYDKDNLSNNKINYTINYFDNLMIHSVDDKTNNELEHRIVLNNMRKRINIRKDYTNSSDLKKIYNEVSLLLNKYKRYKDNMSNEEFNSLRNSLLIKRNELVLNINNSDLELDNTLLIIDRIIKEIDNKVVINFHM